MAAVHPGGARPSEPRRWPGDSIEACEAEAFRAEAASWERVRLVERYLRGQCGTLALAVHDRTGWPTVGVFDAPGGLFTEKPRHVACQAPDGRYVDARGEGLDEAGLVEGFRLAGGMSLEVRPFAPEAVRRMFRSRTETDHILAAEHLAALLPGLAGPAEEAEGPRPF